MTPIKSIPSRRLLALAACLALSCSAWAQEVSAVSLDSVPPDLIEADPAQVEARYRANPAQPIRLRRSDFSSMAA